MNRETVGTINCPFCARVADARKNKHGKLYYSCMTCGLVQPHLPAFQEWMLQNIKIEAPNTGAPKPEATDPPAPEPAPAQKPKQPKKSIFDCL